MTAPNFYAKARAETLGLLGWKSDDGLTPDQVMRLDLCTSLRLAIDDMNGRLARGEPADVTKLLAANDALERYLPARNLPPPQREGDPSLGSGWPSRRFATGLPSWRPRMRCYGRGQLRQMAQSRW